ncbi:MAG: hypothetical protein HY810_10770 [Candidatus Omnitrophica bacterium]|nr:hypothetical protein [Candidatus Omnitrophota bacterium]
MKKLKLRYKFTLIFFGGFLAVLLLEILLQFSSFWAVKLLLRDEIIESLPDRENHLVVFCFGDSFTYGIGAGSQESYPAQLEQILSGYYINKKIKVINFGVPGSNSSQLVIRLKKAFVKLKPDAVIIICGANDNWNFSDVPVNKEFCGIFFKSLCGKLRINKFWAILCKDKSGYFTKWNSPEKEFYLDGVITAEKDINKLILYGNLFREHKYFSQAQKCYEKALRFNPSNETALIELSRCFKLNKEYVKAYTVLIEAMRDNPGNEQLLTELKDILIRQNDPETAVEIFSSLFERFPENRIIVKELANAYKLCAGNFLIIGRFNQAKFFYSRAAKIDLNNNSIGNMIAVVDSLENLCKNNFYEGNCKKAQLLKRYLWSGVMGDVSAQHKILLTNLTKTARICSKKKVPVLFSGYPAFTPEAMRDVAACFNIPLVKHEDIFMAKIEQGSALKYFVSKSDPHCTKEGYRILAENLAAELLKIFKQAEQEQAVN